MAIITKPSIYKGQTAAFTLSKSELLQHAMVVADSYFSDSSNWYRVNVVYKSSSGSQYEIVEFDATLSTPVGSFLVSNQARNSFEIQKLVILDFDGGFLEIPRSEVQASEFDINFQSSQPPSNLSLYHTRMFISSSYSAPAVHENTTGGSNLQEGKLIQVGFSILGENNYGIVYPRSAAINTETKSSNLKVRLYVDSIEGSGTYAIYWTDHGAESALTATTAQILVSVAANGYHEFDLTRLSDDVPGVADGGPGYYNLSFNFVGASSSDIIRISKFEIYQQD